MTSLVAVGERFLQAKANRQRSRWKVKIYTIQKSRRGFALKGFSTLSISC